MIGVSGQSMMISRKACPSANCSPMTDTTISACRPRSMACLIIHSGPSNTLTAAPVLSHSSTQVARAGGARLGFIARSFPAIPTAGTRSPLLHWFAPGTEVVAGPRPNCAQLGAHPTYRRDHGGVIGVVPSITECSSFDLVRARWTTRVAGTGDLGDRRWPIVRKASYLKIDMQAPSSAAENML
jgi:hypothetical protein